MALLITLGKEFTSQVAKANIMDKYLHNDTRNYFLNRLRAFGAFYIFRADDNQMPQFLYERHCVSLRENCTRVMGSQGSTVASRRHYDR